MSITATFSIGSVYKVPHTAQPFSRFNVISDHFISIDIIIATYMLIRVYMRYSYAWDLPIFAYLGQTYTSVHMGLRAL